MTVFVIEKKQKKCIRVSGWNKPETRQSEEEITWSKTLTFYL